MFIVPLQILTKGNSFFYNFIPFNLIWADMGVPAFIENNMAADIPWRIEIIFIKAHPIRSDLKIIQGHGFLIDTRLVNRPGGGGGALGNRKKEDLEY